MLRNIITNLEKILPDAFIDKEPMIPWINKKTTIINLREILEFPIPPTIFIDPEVEVSEVDEELEKEIRETGVEALAYYIPFHQSKKRWGIYFRVRGVFYLSNYFKNKGNFNDINNRIKWALEILFYHEFFHFLSEVTAAHMEMTYKKPLYNDYQNFLKVAPISLHIEEALANVYVLKYIKKYHSHIKKFFDMQPLPYSQYSQFIEDISFLIGKRKLGAIIRIHNLSEITQTITSFPAIDEPFWEFLFNVMPEKLFLQDLPIYFVIEKDHPSSNIRFITPVFMGVQIAVYPCDHPPPHIHIWIPAHNKRDGRYLYPSLEPYKNAKPLSNRERKKVQKVIEKYKDKIESILYRQEVGHR
ncbi:MAG: hypothetical protein QXO40_03505 [Candidatus Aenigmatarchaeota archaeon]